MRDPVFFDLDGTLTDPMPGITGSIQYALQRLDLPVPDAGELTWCIGPPLLDSLCKLVGDELAPTALAHYRERFGDVGLFENTPYPGVVETLEALSTAGHPLYVASSKPIVFVERIIERFHLDQHFVHLFGSELDGTRADKTELLGHALAATGATPAESTMIGDREHDIIGANRNGMPCIGVLYGYGSAEELTNAGADRLASAPAELMGMLL